MNAEVAGLRLILCLLLTDLSVRAVYFCFRPNSEHHDVRFPHTRLQTNPEKSDPAFSNFAIADCAKSLVSDTYLVRMVSTCCIE